MSDVQRQGRPAEQATAPLLQALLAVEEDLNGLVGLGWKAAARGLFPRPLQRRAPRAEGPEHLLIQRTVEPTILAAPERVHHHQGGAATVLALVPLLPPLLPTPMLALRPAPM